MKGCRNMKHIVYTDGACSGNPGKGGWAFAYVENGKITHSDYGLDNPTTNNKMELTAIIEALRYILETKGNQQTVIIHTDSTYCMNSMNEWVHGWKKRGWTKANGRPIENPELIQTLYHLCYECDLKVEWIKVKAHLSRTHKDYDPFNDFVDQLATKHLS